MGKKWKHSKSSMIRGVLVTVCAVLFFLGGRFESRAAGTGKIKVGSAIIRQSADTNSAPVATSSQGTVVTINSEVTDASGSVWYEIQVDANTIDYVRSDLVEKEGGSDTGAAEAAQNNAGFAPGAEIGPEETMEAQYATIKVRAAKIRTAASTSKGIVDSIPEGHQVVISGKTNGSDKPWYYITFTGMDGTEKSGYVRSDLVTLGDMVPVQAPEEQPPEEAPPEEIQPEPEQEVNNDYELIYEPNEEGNYEWYLYDRTGAETNKQSVKEVLDAVHGLEVNQSIDAKTVAKQRIVLIVLIGVIVLLAVVITIMVFKLRDASYEDDDDDEDDEDDEEEDRRREAARRRRAEREEQPAARRRPPEQARGAGARRPEESGRNPEARRSQGAGRPADGRRPSDARRMPERSRQMPDREVRYEEDAPPVRTGTKRKARNFMMDDDEFEFEFLNMKDKDRDV